MSDGFEPLLEKLKKCLGSRFKGISVIAFGSVARGEAKDDSDLDLLVLNADSKKMRKGISDTILDLEKEHDKNIQLIFSDDRFSGLDRTFVEAVLRDGIPLLGKLPDVTLDRLSLEPYRIIRYDMKALPQEKKMRLRRLMYGMRTKKRYKDKLYENGIKGVVDEVKGLRMGIASVLVPEKEAWKVEQVLRANGAVIRSIAVWLSKA